MKTRTILAILILVSTALIGVGDIAPGQDKVEAPIESVYGTWVNPDYNVRYYWAKMTIRPDGTFTYYNNTEFTEGREGKYTPVNSWVDSDGNKYYQMQVFAGYIGKTEFHELWRINNDNTVFEEFLSDWEYPTEIDPEHARYRIFYRQE
jgi:hypothetical protein